MNTRSGLVAAAVLLAAGVPSSGQVVEPAGAPADRGNQGTAPIPDFSGIWARISFPGFEPPLAGPGPIINTARASDGGPTVTRWVGDYTNPILKPEAAEIVKRRGVIEAGGVHAPSPRSYCWPGGVPFVFTNTGMQMFQQPDRITFLYNQDHEVRFVRMNGAHPASLTPSWYGDSVGHYEGDALVIDTVGVKIGPFAMVDVYGSPHTPALHVVERYRLVDYETAKAAEESAAKENLYVAQDDTGLARDPDYQGKGLQLEFTVDDDGVFTTPWTATVTYRRPSAPLGQWPEYVCASNANAYDPHDRGKHAAMPTADQSDF